MDRVKAQLATAAPQGVTDFAVLLSRLQSAIGGAPAVAPAEPLEIIRASVGNTVRMIPVEEVCYFQSADKYTSVVTQDAELLIRMPLKDLLAQLPAQSFRQIHRGTVVRLDEVAAAVRDESGRLSLRLKHRNESLAVSRVFAEQFRPL